MAGFSISIAGLATVATLFAAEVAAQCSGVTARYQPKMGTGHRAVAIATGLRSPRGIALDTAGNLLVVEQQGGAVKRLVLAETGDNICVQSSGNVVTGGASNHGIAFSANGTMLFLSNLNSVTAYDYNAATGAATNPKVVITGMQTSTVHPTRTILTSIINPDALLVARGSNNNIDTGTTDRAQARSIIKQFSIRAILASPVQYASGGEILGWGLRNIVGMGEDPMFGGVWSVENSMDDVRLGGRDVHNENPAEKMNFHGALNDTANNLKGANYGYPTCVAAWDTGLLQQNSLSVGSLFKPDSTPAGDCTGRQQGRLHFPSHTAPLDVKFLPDGSEAYISFHGSWNRNPPDGYRLMKVQFSRGQPVAQLDSKTAAIPVMENSNTQSCPRSCFRPVGLAIDKKHRVYMSSDSSGEVYVVYGAKPPAR